MFKGCVSPLRNAVFRDGTIFVMAPNRSDFIHRAVDNSRSLKEFRVMVRNCAEFEGGQVESNERYYRRREVQERMAAQRAVTEQARAWHSKLAEDFAARAMTTTSAVGA